MPSMMKKVSQMFVKAGEAPPADAEATLERIVESDAGAALIESVVSQSAANRLAWRRGIRAELDRLRREHADAGTAGSKRRVAIVAKVRAAEAALKAVQVAQNELEAELSGIGHRFDREISKCERSLRESAPVVIDQGKAKFEAQVDDTRFGVRATTAASSAAWLAAQFAAREALAELPLLAEPVPEIERRVSEILAGFDAACEAFRAAGAALETKQAPRV